MIEEMRALAVVPARAAGCRFVGMGTAFAQCRGFDGISLATLRELPEAIARDFNEL